MSPEEVAFDVACTELLKWRSASSSVEHVQEVLKKKREEHAGIGLELAALSKDLDSAVTKLDSAAAIVRKAIARCRTLSEQHREVPIDPPLWKHPDLTYPDTKVADDADELPMGTVSRDEVPF